MVGRRERDRRQPGAPLGDACGRIEDGAGGGARLMRVCVALEQRFDRCPDGSIWTQSGFGTSFWTRYLDVFDRVRILARVRDVPRLEGMWHRVDAGPVAFVAVPY